MGKLSKREIEKQQRHDRFAGLLDEAHRAGMAAVFTACAIPDPSEPNSWRTNPFTVEHIGNEACGFAWITANGNTSFGRWAAKHGGWGNSGGPPTFGVGYFGQSEYRKSVYARAYAAVLQEAGIQVRAGSCSD